MELTEDERRTLLAEAELLDRVAVLATGPGQVTRSDLDVVLRVVEVPGSCRCRRARAVPRQRCRPEA